MRRALRRLVADGTQPAKAVDTLAAPTVGAQWRVQRWQDLQAQTLGLTTALRDLLDHPQVTDVLINSGHAWADFGRGLQPVDVGVATEQDARRLAIQMAAAASRRLDDAAPIVDATLGGRIRLHAVLPPLARAGTTISLRVIRSDPFTLEDLVASGSIHPAVAEQLRQFVADGASVLLSGATGVGKTTLLATLLGLVPKDHRIVLIEEVSELAVTHPHVVPLQARPANIEGQGELGLEELVRAAVRMRPDRLVLGECRGAEVREVLTALNTGHEGGFATIHANSIQDVPARLLALGMLGGLGKDTVALLGRSAFDRVIHLKRGSQGSRYVSEIGRLQLQDGGLVGIPTLRVDERGALHAV